MLTIVFAVFVLLAAFNAGAMTTLQIQHYAIYPHVGRDSFVAYIRANNRAAVIPAIVPAMALLVVSLVLVPLALNVIALVSTFTWQRRLQGEMAETGYDDAKTRLLISTNWIRTLAFMAQAVLATMIVARALS